MLRRLAVGLLVIVLLSGCSGAGVPADGLVPDAAVPATPLALAPLDLADCHEQIGIFPISHADAAPNLPMGFEPLPPLPPSMHPDADPTGQTATLLFVAFLCNLPTPTTFLIPWIPVMPPESLRAPGVTYHAVAPLALAGSPDALVWFSAAGIATLEVELSQTDLVAPSPAGVVSTVRAQGDGVAFMLEGASPRLAAETPQEWLRIFFVQGQGVTATLDLHISAHTHWQFGPARVQATGLGVASPTQPGLSTHSAPGMWLNLTKAPMAPS